ncbi:hypothetical protein VKY20_11530, partial [Pseudomonas atacamensis]|nr:hypothetical protein [Pseudomonas atacamensis]
KPPRSQEEGVRFFVPVISRILWKSIVGASLLANAIDHSMNVSTDMPLSRAGSLPQGGWQV